MGVLPANVKLSPSIVIIPSPALPKSIERLLNPTPPVVLKLETLTEFLNWLDRKKPFLYSRPCCQRIEKHYFRIEVELVITIHP